MIGDKIAGNLLLAGPILFSGNTFQNVNSLAQCLNLAFIGRSTFYDMQKDVLFPVVDKAWKDHQVDPLNETKESSKLDICGDVIALGTVQSMAPTLLWRKKAVKF